MQIKLLNAYRITHLNGSVEEVNASDLTEALGNMEISESYSPVLQTFRVKDNVRTLVNDASAEVMFSSVVSDGNETAVCTATPASGTIHVGDKIALKAIPARNYAFVAWKRNGIEISTSADYIYTMTELEEGSDTCVFTAIFKLADVAWTATVSPAEASGAGCLAFPESGTTEAAGELKLLAVAEGSYTFDHWERNGVTITTNRLMNTNCDVLASDETAAVYTAVFTAGA